MNEELLQRLEIEAEKIALDMLASLDDREFTAVFNAEFAELIVRECINKIEAHEIPVGNSAAGEMACEWTYAALKEIRDDIKQHFGIKSRQWVGLTDEDIAELRRSGLHAISDTNFRAIEAKLKEKNSNVQ